MITLLLTAAVAAGAANVALVTFVADRLSPQSDASVPASGKRVAVKAVNENAAAAKLAA
jgi:hypothetical protein